MFQSKKTNSLGGVHHARKFHFVYRCVTQYAVLKCLKYELPSIITESATHQVIVMDWWSFGQSQQNFLLTS